jgi:hypothetical protein
VLARVLGNDLDRLVERIDLALRTPVNAADAHSVGIHFEAEFAAGVLASLALDPSLAGRIVSSDSGLLNRVVAFLKIGAPALSVKVCASLCVVLRRAAAHSEEHLSAVLQAGALEAVIQAARAPDAASICIVEALAACGDLTLVPDHVVRFDTSSSSSSTRGLAWLVSLLDVDAPSDPVLFVSCLHLVHATQVRFFSGLLPLRLTEASDHFPRVNRIFAGCNSTSGGRRWARFAL